MNVATRLTFATQQTFARNDRYLEGLVEQHSICPFARPCRHEQKLWRSVSWTRELEANRLAALCEQLEQIDEPVEVALLLLPGLRGCSPAEVDALHRDVRANYQRRTGGPTYYVVPFHPESPCNATDAGTLVRYWRRSPDPCFQFVQIETLEAVKRADPKEEQNRLALRLFSAGYSADEVLAALQQQPNRQGTSQRVAEQNLERFQKLGQPVFDAAIEAAIALKAPIVDTNWPDIAWQPVFDGSAL